MINTSAGLGLIPIVGLVLGVSLGDGVVVPVALVTN